MDINMPILNGYETTKLLRKMMMKNEISHSKIVACTAYVSEDDKA